MYAHYLPITAHHNKPTTYQYKLILSCQHCTQLYSNTLYHFTFVTREFSKKNLKLNKGCWSNPNVKLSFKYFVNLFYWGVIFRCKMDADDTCQDLYLLCISVFAHSSLQCPKATQQMWWSYTHVLIIKDVVVQNLMEQIIIIWHNLTNFLWTFHKTMLTFPKIHGIHISHW